jgi:hypothetical protein
MRALSTIKHAGKFFLAVACLFMSTAMATGSSPKMSGDVSSPECSDAFLLAKTMFNSKSSRLYAPLSIPDRMKSELVLGASGLDISGGGALEANEDQFERVPQLGNAAIRSVYWGKNAKHGVRIAVKETPLGWRGDMYSLYLLDANVGSNDFLKDTQEDYGKSKYSALVQDTWRPPLVLLLSSSKKIWFIDVGQPYQILADWAVYKETSNGFERGCIVRFRPEGANAMALLPKSVQRVAHLLDETIGPGRDEGTLQPTARLRLQVQHVWANAALRPWALSDSDTYNSTDEVEAGLVAWSQKGPSYSQVRKEILRAYPLAEQDLSGYYIRQFNLPKKKANSLAKWVLDIALRANYTFPNGGDYFRYNNVNTNPWGDDFGR